MNKVKLKGKWLVDFFYWCKETIDFFFFAIMMKQMLFKFSPVANWLSLGLFDRICSGLDSELSLLSQVGLARPRAGLDAKHCCLRRVESVLDSTLGLQVWAGFWTSGPIWAQMSIGPTTKLEVLLLGSESESLLWLLSVLTLHHQDLN